MRRKFFLIFFAFFILIFNGTGAQELIRNRSVTGVCYAGNKINRIYIPPPKGFLDRQGAKGGGKITVIYSGFTAEAKNAVAFAVGILEAALPAGLRMTVKTSWTKISTAGVLGNSSIQGFSAGWNIDAPDPEAYYPVTVAEKIAGRSLNEDNEADVELVLNSTAKWYLGTDGNTPTTKYDLVTVVIHELCHGLGFFDSMSVSGSTGDYGLGSRPVIYDKFIENLSEKKLTDTLYFKRNSTELYNELTGGQLYFDGPLTRRYLLGRARLYAPSEFDPGSSISHLDELRTATADALMTPFLDFGEAIHNPGKLTMSILGDVGWVNTRILPEKLNDTEQHITQINVKTTIKSDTTYNRNLVGLVYSYNGFLSADTIMLLSALSDDTYSGTIPVPFYNSRLSYYFFAVDDFSRLFRSPSRASKAPYTLFIGTDTVKPVISHTPAKYYFEKIDSISFKAGVTDNLGIDTVYIEYKVNGGVSEYLGLLKVNQDQYRKAISLKSGLVKGGDILSYRIIAVDNAAGHNMRTSPSTGFYDIKIESVLPVVKSYSTDFSDAAADFLNSGFSIYQPLNFSSVSLNSEHPYKSPDEDYKSLEFSSVLRHPIVFDVSGMEISFREVVLVEPGADGSVFGFSDFYDYVVLEASKDYGKTWFGLADGYDSRIIPSWADAFNSMMMNGNSIYSGKESMLLEHKFYPRVSDNISSGDSLLIRFRLYSDPYTNGWGWVIDDLRMSPLVDKVEDLALSDLTVYPNPGDGHLKIRIGDTGDYTKTRLNIYNPAGVCIIRNLTNIEQTISIDISVYQAGLYFIVINNGSKTWAIKYSLIK